MSLSVRWDGEEVGRLELPDGSVLDAVVDVIARRAALVR